MLQEKSKVDKAQVGAPDNSIDSHAKGIEFSDDLNKSNGSDEDTLDSNECEQETTWRNLDRGGCQIEFCATNKI